MLLWQGGYSHLLVGQIFVPDSIDTCAVCLAVGFFQTRPVLVRPQSIYAKSCRSIWPRIRVATASFVNCRRDRSK